MYNRPHLDFAQAKTCLFFGQCGSVCMCCVSFINSATHAFMAVCVSV